MKPRVFIGSSVESLEIAYELQENLEFYAEVTVWTQGIFELSKYTLDSLLDVVDSSDFGIFIFSPDDISIIRDKEKNTVRDNVIFELGLFVGKLGKERAFIVMPRSCEDNLALPTDLIGITPALFDQDRQDGNMQAALGPASSKINKAIKKQGTLQSLEKIITKTEIEEDTLIYSEGDIKAILGSWFGSRSVSENIEIIYYKRIDKELKIPEGSTKKYIKEIASRWKLVVGQEGDHTILFEKEPIRYQNTRRIYG